MKNMKKKEIIVSIAGILLVSAITVVLISKNNRKYVMYDGMMLAMTLTNSNGTQTITEFPSGTNYSVEVDCGDTAIGRWLGEEWKLSIENIKENVVCNVDFYEKTSSDKLSSIVQTAGICSDTSYKTKTKCQGAEEIWTTTITNANGYRYSGTNPDNYVWFNNELWRIIGLIPVCTNAASGTCSDRTISLVKIIRAESIGSIAYDGKSSNYTGLWGSNTLYALLNTYYYGKKDGTGTVYCYGYQAKAKGKCDYRKIGISDDSNDYYGKMVEPVYWNIGASVYTTSPDIAYGNENVKVTTNLSKIGLMGVSDYGYSAAIDGYEIQLYIYGTPEITIANWLYGQGKEWTIIQNSNNTAFPLYINWDGGVSNTYGSASFGFSVRPVVYLDAEVYRISGSGTMFDPYIIGM